MCFLLGSFLCIQNVSNCQTDPFFTVACYTRRASCGPSHTPPHPRPPPPSPTHPFPAAMIHPFSARSDRVHCKKLSTYLSRTTFHATSTSLWTRTYYETTAWNRAHEHQPLSDTAPSSPQKAVLCKTKRKLFDLSLGH